MDDVLYFCDGAIIPANALGRQGNIGNLTGFSVFSNFSAWIMRLCKGIRHSPRRLSLCGFFVYVLSTPPRCAGRESVHGCTGLVVLRIHTAGWRHLFLFGIQGVCGQIETVVVVMDDGFQVVGSALDVHRDTAALEAKIAPEAFGNFRGFHVTVIDEEVERFRLFRVITLAFVAAGIADDVFFFNGSCSVFFRTEVMGRGEVEDVIRCIQPGLVALQGAGLVFGQVERGVAFGGGGAAVAVVLAGGVVIEDVVGFFQLVERVMHASDGEKEEFGDAIEVFALERGFEQYPGIAFIGDFLKECRGGVDFLQQFVADGFVFVF